jgi:hypothetical protein
MKLTLSTCLLALPSGQAYLTAPAASLQRRPSTFLKSTDAAFSAFADSLENEPEPEVEKLEKKWQAKLEDLLDPQTNMAERQILMSELLSSNDEIRESVLDAIASRKVRRVSQSKLLLALCFLRYGCVWIVFVYRMDNIWLSQLTPPRLFYTIMFTNLLDRSLVDSYGAEIARRNSCCGETNCE